MRVRRSRAGTREVQGTEKMSRTRIWLGLLIPSVAVIVASTPAAAQQPKKPNIVFMLADNLGYGELGGRLWRRNTSRRAGLVEDHFIDFDT